MVEGRKSSEGEQQSPEDLLQNHHGEGSAESGGVADHDTHELNSLNLLERATRTLDNVSSGARRLAGEMVQGILDFEAGSEELLKSAFSVHAAKPKEAAPAPSSHNPAPENPSTPPGNPAPENPSTPPGNPAPENPSTPPGNPAPENPSTAPGNPAPENPSTPPGNPAPENPSTAPGNPAPENPSTAPGNPAPENPSTPPDNPPPEALSAPSTQNTAPEALNAAAGPANSPEVKKVKSQDVAPADMDDSFSGASPTVSTFVPLAPGSLEPAKSHPAQASGDNGAPTAAQAPAESTTQQADTLEPELKTGLIHQESAPGLSESTTFQSASTISNGPDTGKFTLPGANAPNRTDNSTATHIADSPATSSASGENQKVHTIDMEAALASNSIRTSAGHNPAARGGDGDVTSASPQSQQPMNPEQFQAAFKEPGDTSNKYDRINQTNAPDASNTHITSNQTEMSKQQFTNQDTTVYNNVERNATFRDSSYRTNSEQTLDASANVAPLSTSKTFANADITAALNDNSNQRFQTTHDSDINNSTTWANQRTPLGDGTYGPTNDNKMIFSTTGGGQDFVSKREPASHFNLDGSNDPNNGSSALKDMLSSKSFASQMGDANLPGSSPGGPWKESKDGSGPPEQSTSDKGGGGDIRNPTLSDNSPRNPSTTGQGPDQSITARINQKADTGVDPAKTDSGTSPASEAPPVLAKQPAADPQKFVTDGQKLTPDAPKLAPDAPKPPDAQKLTPDAQKLTPDAQKLTPDAQKLTPDAQKLTPDAQKLTPDAQKLTPDAQKLTPDAQKLTPDAQKLSPDAPKPLTESPSLAAEKQKPPPESSTIEGGLKPPTELGPKKKTNGFDEQPIRYVAAPASPAATDASVQKAFDMATLANTLARIAQPVNVVASLDSLTNKASSPQSGDSGPGSAAGKAADVLSGAASLASLSSRSASGTDAIPGGQQAAAGRTAASTDAASTAAVMAAASGNAALTTRGPGAPLVDAAIANALITGRGIFNVDPVATIKAGQFDSQIDNKALTPIGSSVASSIQGTPLGTVKPSAVNGTLIDAEGRTVKVDPLTGRLISQFADDGKSTGTVKLAEMKRIQKTLGERRYLTGVEIAIACAIASAAVAKTKDKETALEEGEGNAASGQLRQLIEDVASNEDNDDKTNANKQNPNLFKRPTYIIAHNDSLVEIAERLFHDSDVAWLIADINAGRITEHVEDGKRIVELRSRQEIELPLHSEVQEFLLAKAKDAKADKMVTIVGVTEIDRELLNSFLSTVVGGENPATAQRPIEIPDVVPPAVATPSPQPLMQLLDFGLSFGRTLMPSMTAIVNKGLNLKTYISKIDMVPANPMGRVLEPEPQS